MSKRTNEDQVTEKTISSQLPSTTDIALSASDVRELIAERAYDYYKLRGAETGDQLSDWLRAEAEVVAMLLAESADIEKPNILAAETKKTRHVMRAANVGQLIRKRPNRKSALKSNPS